MKNLFSLSLTLIWSIQLLAQPSPRTEEYCRFTLAGAFGRPGKCSIRLDSGQERPGWPSLLDKLRDEDGQLILFNSAVDALNYLNGYGWELHTVYNDSSDTYYVMRRRMSMSEETPLPPEYQ